VDIFVCLCTACELITGKRALEGNRTFQIAIAAISGARLPIPRKCGPEFMLLMERVWAIVC
jgi:hypothetical protein